MALPERLVAPVARAKLQTDGGTSSPLQATFAEFLADGDYDRHLRTMRHRYRRRRDAVIAALARHLPSLPVGGAAAGLHLTVGLPDHTVWPSLRLALHERRLTVACTNDYRTGPPTPTTRLVLGYGNLDSSVVDEAVSQLAQVLNSSGILA
jgi:GntR family transcriptional regulator/MocR family aminotransferase